MSIRAFAIAFLLAQAAGACAWWAVLAAWPPSRAYFRAEGAPDATLLAFGPADLLLFAGASAASGYGFWTGRRWAWPLLCAHAGAAAYAALYCWGLAALTGDGLLGALLMSPSLVVPVFLAWRLRPPGAAC